MTVHVLTVDAGTASFVSAHATAKQARERLYQYVADCWDTEGPEDEPLPTDRDQAIELYFTHRHDEIYAIMPCKVEKPKRRLTGKKLGRPAKTIDLDNIQQIRKELIAAGTPAGSARIAEILKDQGIDVSRELVLRTLRRADAAMLHST